MLLKRISVSGFKSFCDRVDFDFGPGVTCIVGPNGCGKSNVVDSIKWVLGEQSARTLRGRQMIDMIFNGSTSRRASSLAQVDLVFDNTDRSLAIDQDEVIVTRKLYRSGESEYQLNRQTGRLKDIRELFMDTGIGGETYAVIEQGRVDGLLQSSPQERRAIFEEAAGISKCRARKKEAQRKLERTEQNLLRVQDIIEEVEKRLRSVKLQAGKARSYRAYEERLNELRSSYALAEYHRLSMTLGDLARQADHCTDQAAARRTEINQLETRELEHTRELDTLAERISEADGRVVRTRSDMAAQEERIAAAQTRREEQQALAERAEERQSADRHRLTEAQASQQAHQQAVEQLSEQVAALEQQVQGLADQERALARESTQAQAVLEDEKAGLVDLLRRSAQTHNEIIRLNTHQESLVGQKGRLRARDAQIASELEEGLGRQAQLEARLREVDELIERETTALAEKKAEAERVNAQRIELTESLAAGKEQRSALLSRQGLLQELDRQQEGVGAAVRRVLTAKERRPDDPGLQRVIGLVAELFETDVAHAPIVEAAIGEVDQALVLADAALVTERADLFADLPGRLAVVALDRLPPVINTRSFADQPGFVTRALDLVRYDSRYEHLARHLLAKTIVVDTLATALRFAKVDVHDHRFVTQAGELVESRGRVCVGPPSTTAGLISRRSELKELEAQLAEAAARVETLADELNRTQAEAAHLEQVQQELRTAIYESNTAKVQATTGLQALRESIDRLSREQPVIAQEVAQLEIEIGDLQQRSADSDRSLEAMQQENTQREERVRGHQERIDALVGQRRDLQEQLTQLRVELGQAVEKRTAALQTIRSLERSCADLAAALEAAGRDVEQCQARATEAEAAAATAQQQLDELTVAVEALEADARRLRHEREQLRAQMEQLAETLKRTRGDLESTEGQMHAVQMKSAETRVRRDELQARVREELDIDLAHQYEQYEHADQDWAAVEEEIADLRGKIARLGNVNLDAIDELAELEQRHEFLSTQCGDLQTSKRQLADLIDRLDTEAAERFRATFDAIRTQFRTLFRKLFGGGRADVVLEDEENLLESGIEVLAQPPGKELQSISLLSGGEKSMTAIALVMSMFKARPAPFAVLDEVDAALDEANNVRFNQIVQEFVSEAQFIVISHSKRTMSIADQLYGITMQEPGVSTRVAVTFAEAQSHVA